MLLLLTVLKIKNSMKKIFYRTTLVVMLAAMVFDLPITIEAAPKVPKNVVKKGVLTACTACATEERAAANAARESEIIGKDAKYVRSAEKEAEEGNKFSKQVKDEVQEYVQDEVKNYIEERIDNYVNTPRQRVITCPQCRGGGSVYNVDAYGNYEVDAYGNPVIYYCPTCNGNGRVIQTY